MMKKNNISLSTLDEFAKRISTVQVNMLYENRMHKKYRKQLFESSNEILDDNFCLYIPNNSYNTKFTQAQFIADAVKNVSDFEYMVTQTGIYFYTKLPNIYEYLKEYLKNNDIEYSDVTNLD